MYQKRKPDALDEAKAGMEWLEGPELIRAQRTLAEVEGRYKRTREAIREWVKDGSPILLGREGEKWEYLLAQDARSMNVDCKDLAAVLKRMKGEVQYTTWSVGETVYKGYVKKEEAAEKAPLTVSDNNPFFFGPFHSPAFKWAVEDWGECEPGSVEWKQYERWCDEYFDVGRRHEREHRTGPIEDIGSFFESVNDVQGLADNPDQHTLSADKRIDVGGMAQGNLFSG
jgi:hypothetical protein